MYGEKDEFREICAEELGRNVEWSIRELGEENINFRRDKYGVEGDIAKALSESVKERIDEEHRPKKGNLYAVRGGDILKKHREAILREEGKSQEEIKAELEEMAYYDRENIIKRYEEKTGKNITSDLQAMTELDPRNEEEENVLESIGKESVYDQVEEAINEIKKTRENPEEVFEEDNLHTFLRKVKGGKYNEADLEMKEIKYEDITASYTLKNFLLNKCYEKLQNRDEEIKETCKQIIEKREELEKAGADESVITKIEQLYNFKIQKKQFKKATGTRSASKMVQSGDTVGKKMIKDSKEKEVKSFDEDQ